MDLGDPLASGILGGPDCRNPEQAREEPKLPQNLQNWRSGGRRGFDASGGAVTAWGAESGSKSEEGARSGPTRTQRVLA